MVKRIRHRIVELSNVPGSILLIRGARIVSGSVGCPGERIIEKAGEVDVTAAAVVAAVQAYGKINATGQWIERIEHVDLNELFERMTHQELEAYARDGSLPTWFTATVGATAAESQEA